MDRKEKLKTLQKLDEKTFTKEFLIPLYESDGMGCKNVRYTHRRLEFGKDIIYYKDDEFGNPIHTGIQVKSTKIRTSDVDKLLRQITEAFGEPFTDSSDGKKKDLDRFVVLTSNEFLGEAKDSLWASLRGANLDKLVTCVEGDQLVDLLDKHCSSVFHSDYPYSDKYIDIIEKLGEMLSSTDSQDFKQFFITNAWLVGVGYKYGDIVPYKKTEVYPRVDLSLETFEHDYDIMILKSHTDSIILGSEEEWRLSEECEIGISQVYRYFRWYKQSMGTEHYKPDIDVYKPIGFIVIGRNTQKDIQNKLNLINNHFQRIQILTYDDLYDKAKRWTEFKTREEKK